MYRGAVKSLARPGRKQTNVSVRMAWISFGALSSRKKLDDSPRLDVVEIARPWYASELVSFLARLRTYQHPEFEKISDASVTSIKLIRLQLIGGMSIYMTHLPSRRASGLRNVLIIHDINIIEWTAELNGYVAVCKVWKLSRQHKSNWLVLKLTDFLGEICGLNLVKETSKSYKFSRIFKAMASKCLKTTSLLVTNSQYLTRLPFISLRLSMYLQLIRLH